MTNKYHVEKLPLNFKIIRPGGIVLTWTGTPWGIFDHTGELAQTEEGQYHVYKMKQSAVFQCRHMNEKEQK